MDYETAAEILEKVGQIATSNSSVWRQAQAWGERFRAIEAAERERANALPRKGETPCQEVEEVGRMGAAMDGGMVHFGKKAGKS